MVQNEREQCDRAQEEEISEKEKNCEVALSIEETSHRHDALNERCEELESRCKGLQELEERE